VRSSCVANGRARPGEPSKQVSIAKAESTFSAFAF